MLKTTFIIAVALAGAIALAPLTAHAAKPKRKGRSARPAASTQRVFSSKQAAEAPVVIPDDPTQIQLVASGAIVIDSFTGEPLFEKNANERAYPASATKILTALLVIEAGDLDRVVVVQPEDTRVEPSAIYFKPGDQHTRRELLYALLLKSANDVAMALARDNAGSVEAFAKKMTERAHQMGATSSHFMNPHGLHHLEHYTTPRDLALIARVAMQQPIFRQFVGTRNFVWNGSQGNIPLTNTNRLLSTLPGCVGLKTGYTLAARHVLVSAVRQEGREAISVVMHSDKPGKWTDSKILLGYAMAHPPGHPDLLLTQKEEPARELPAIGGEAATAILRSNPPAPAAGQKAQQ